MISVIVPVYNAEQYIHRCVDSILTQSYVDLELLLVNDGSVDNSGAICDEYAAKDSRVRVFHKANGGVSSARNLGIKEALGEYITFCDADDYVGVDWLAAYSDAIVDGADFAVQGMYHIGESETQPKALAPQIGSTIIDKQKLILELISQDVFGYVGVKLFSKGIIDRFHIYYDEKSAVWEDGQFIAQYLEHATSFVCVSYIGYYYFLPPVNKKYNGDSSYSVYYMLKSFDLIFEKNIPLEILSPWFDKLKNFMILNIVYDKPLNSECFDLYHRMVKLMSQENKVIHSLIQHSQSRYFCRVLLRIVHKLLS